MGKSYKALYEQADKQNRQKDETIASFGTKLAELQNTSNAKSVADAQKITDLEQEVGTAESEKEELEEKVTQLSEQLRKDELSRFASAYKDQEGEYKTQQDLWFKFSLWATGLLTLSVIASIFGPLLLQENQWHEKSAFYLLDIIFLTLFVYALKQHTHLGNLRVDYANRKTLAQSYQYIIEDEGETSEIRTRFLDRAANVFSSKALLRSGEITWYEAIIAKFLGPKSGG